MPPAYGVLSAASWQAEQSPALARYSPRAINAGSCASAESAWTPVRFSEPFSLWQPDSSPVAPATRSNGNTNVSFIPLIASVPFPARPDQPRRDPYEDHADQKTRADQRTA